MGKWVGARRVADGFAATGGAIAAADAVEGLLREQGDIPRRASPSTQAA